METRQVGRAVAAVALAVLAIAGSAPQAGRLAAKWIGQDGHDLVGPRSQPGPSDVEDMRFALSGLDARKQVKHVVVRGLGGDEWQYEGPFGPYRAELVRRPNSPRADIYVEPSRVETGRAFTITVTYDDGSTAEVIVGGGRADPGKRMATAKLEARWVGQDGRDRAGLGPGVGPDGKVDAVLALGKLSAGAEVRSVEARTKDGATWRAGILHEPVNAAWLARSKDDPGRAELFLQPDRDRRGQLLRLRVIYGDGATDEAEVEMGPADPSRAVARQPVPTLAPLDLKTRWLGQPDTAGERRGLVAVELTGLPRGRTVTGAVLSDPTGAVWVADGGGPTLDAGSFPRPLLWERGPASAATIRFHPVRDETGATLDLRLRLDDGTEALAAIEGGPADPSMRSPAPAGPSITAQPGDDLIALARTAGAIRLAKGTYALDRPWVLERPIAVSGEAGAVVRFAQPADAAPWTAAIKIHGGNTTLEGFAVAFAGPARWDAGVSYGPAVIGTTDDRDGPHPDPKAGLTFRNLRLEGPPPAQPGGWEEAPDLLRLVSAASGVIEGCDLRGGSIELAGGPWRIEKNRHRGTPPGSFTFSIVSAHGTRELVVAGNEAFADGPSGKTWRFLVLTAGGWRGQVRDNRIKDVGPRDDDAHNENAPEIILTESYRLRFEGAPLALSEDRRVLVIPEPQGDAPEPGDVVAIVAGPHAGRTRSVSQRLSRTAVLVDRPLPPLAEMPVIALGAAPFRGMRFEGNAIDARGGTRATGFVLAGMHDGTKVLGNTVVGGGEALRIVAPATEQPGPWGWSHAPMFGVDVTGNRIEGALRGATVAVEHGEPISAARGRVAFSGWLRDNVVVPPPGVSPPPAIVAGDARGLDRRELVLVVGGNTVEGGPAGSEAVRVEAAVVYPDER